MDFIHQLYWNNISVIAKASFHTKVKSRTTFSVPTRCNKITNAGAYNESYIQKTNVHMSTLMLKFSIPYESGVV